MKSGVLIRSGIKGVLTLTVLMVFSQSPVRATDLSPAADTVSLKINTQDGLSLPAQVIRSGHPDAKMILFINGATPYDEKGNQWAAWDENGRLLKSKQEFFTRFLDIMPAKGYNVSIMAKRSFIDSHAVPRPNLDDYALDIYFFVMELRKRELLRNMDDLILAGYSEGSVVATKVLGLLKEQPSACILLGSGSYSFDYKGQTWEEWFNVDMLRRSKGWTDEQIRKEYEQWSTMMNDLLDIDEETWENEWKKHPPFGFGLAPWESYYVDRELIFYDPLPNLLEANVPVLICSGENDTAMPMELSRRTYESLLNRGYKKASFRVIEEEVHQYRKHDVFAIMDAWLISGGESTDFVLGHVDSVIIEKQGKIRELTDRINELSWRGGEPEKALACFNKTRDSGLQDPNQWLPLGIKLFANGFYQESLFALSKATDPDFDMCFLAMVWMGHLCDLTNNRDEAISWYRKGLEHFLFPVTHSQWEMTVDRDWIGKRMETPFTGIK